MSRAATKIIKDFVSKDFVKNPGFVFNLKIKIVKEET
jgi:hypothetical protein